MALTLFDWSIVAAVLLTILFVGLYVSKRASASSSSFFLGGRNMPWWLLGTSMVATTFATDTPNLVTGLVRTGGVAANWVWWAFLITGMLTACVYAKLWRRLGVTTDIEFYERRYSGKPAAFLRGFRAIYLGVFFNVMIMANVTLAITKFGNVLFNVSPIIVVIVAATVTVIFSAAGGLLGVLITDMILFVISMIGAICAAYYAVNHESVGGLDALLSAPDVISKMDLLPDFSDPNQWIPLLLIPLAVQWWSAWYPGAEPGGGGYVAQRMLSAKNERHAAGATTFFNFAHYALRPWPWILVALASIVVFPDLDSIRTALPHVDESLIKDDLAYPAMLTFLPSGLLGLVVASLVAAYVSTISTSLNWGASYTVNDVYLRFIKPDATPKQQVMMGRLMTVCLMAITCVFALMLESAMQAFNLLLSVGAGTGLLFLVRWFWHRVNAWSEISAMIISFSVSIYMQFFGPEGWADWQIFTVSVAITTVGWITVTLFTGRTDQKVLDEFDASLVSELEGDEQSVRSGVIAALWATAGVYSLLFGTGNLLYGEYHISAMCLAVMLIAVWRTKNYIMSIPEK